MIIINGTDLADLGFTAHSRTLPALPVEQSATLTIPGGFPIRTGGVFPAGQLSVSGSMAAPATGDRAADHALLLSRRDTLAALLDGESVLRFADLTDREWVGWLQASSRFNVFDPQWVQRVAEVSLDYQLPDPRARARTETVRVDSGALVLGSAPTPLRVEFTGAAGTIRVRAGGAGGSILTQLVWAGSSGAVVIDSETQSVSVDGLNGIVGITAASVFPIADPLEGADYVEVPAGSTVRYRARWW